MISNIQMSLIRNHYLKNFELRNFIFSMSKPNFVPTSQPTRRSQRSQLVRQFSHSSLKIDSPKVLRKELADVFVPEEMRNVFDTSQHGKILPFESRECLLCLNQR